eukprot:g16900.t1
MCSYGYHYLVGTLHLLSSALPLVAAAGSNPQCLTADAMIGGMRHYLIDWDKQLDYASNKTWTCEDFAKFMYNFDWLLHNEFGIGLDQDSEETRLDKHKPRRYNSRDRIQQELFYTYSNMTTVPAPPTSQASEQEDGDPVVNVTDAELPEGFGDLPWIMSHVNKAASLVSASVHVNSGLGVLRQECFQEPAVHLLFFVSLRRIHQLMLNQMKYLWYLMQNTPEMYRGAATQWIMESSQVFRGDLDTVESIFGGWNPPNTTKGEEKELVYSKYEKPKVAAFPVVSIVELLRRQTFKETDFDRELVRASMRHVFDKNDLILELGAGVGDMSRWLNETGWVQAHGYDYSADIELITFNNVHQLRGEKAPPRLGDGDIPYDWLICVSEQCPMMWSAIRSHYPGDKLREYTKKGIIVEKTAEGEMDLSAMKRSEPHATVYANRGLGEKYTVYTH